MECGLFEPAPQNETHLNNEAITGTVTQMPHGASFRKVALPQEEWQTAF
jgi:hypothetical protein